MKHANRIISLVLLLCMLAASLAACGGDKPAVTTPQVTSSTPGENVTTPAETGEQLIVPMDKSYEGYKFVFLTTGHVAYNDFDFAEDSTASVVDNAQFQRKLKVEEMFDITIEQQTAENKASGSNPGYEKLRQAHTANEAMYDLMNIGGYCAAKSAISNYLYDLNSTTYIDTTKSWWDQNANDDMTLNGVLFFTNGALSGARSESTFVIFYNKTLGATKKLEAPYQLIRDKKWTLDTFASMCLEVSEELTGNDTRDPGDRYGLYCWDDAIVGMMAATGTRCVTIEDGAMTMTLYSDKSEEAFNKFTSIVYNKDYCLTYQRYSGQMNVVDSWCNDQALFWATSNVNTAKMQEMNSDFSILPYPMLNEAQGRYYTTIAPYNSQFIAMPAIQEDEERTSAIAETLAYEGKQILTPALYERTLKTNQVRDEDSADMLDIIYDSYMYDLGYYFSIGNITSQLMNLIRNYDTGFASMWARIEKAANTQLDKYNKDLTTAAESWKTN